MSVIFDVESVVMCVNEPKPVIGHDVWMMLMVCGNADIPKHDLTERSSPRGSS